MNHALLVGIVNSKTDRCEEMDEVGRGGKFACTGSITKIVSHRLPLHVIHDHVCERLFCFWRTSNVKIVNLYDIGVMQRCNHLRFSFKARKKVRIALQVGMKYFDSDITSQLGV